MAITTVYKRSPSLEATVTAAVGLTTDAAVVTDADGTLSAKLRGLVKMMAENLVTVLGATTGAAVVSDAAGTIQQYLRGLVTLFAVRIPASLGAKTAAASFSVTQDSDTSWGVALEADDLPNVGNAPVAAPLDVTDNANHEVAAVDLVPGTKYELMLVPWNNGVAAGKPTDFIRGVWKCAAAGGSIATLADGRIITSYSPIIINLPAGSPKVRVYFMRHDDTPIDCRVYLSVCDS